MLGIWNFPHLFPEAAEQAGEHPLQIVLRRHLSVRREFVDELREQGAEGRGELRALHSGLLGELLDLLSAEHLVHLVWRDGLVLAGADPGLQEMAEALFVKLLGEAGEAVAGAVFCDEAAGNLDERVLLTAVAASCAAEN